MIAFDARKVIAIARAELGVYELTTNNDHPRIEMYLNKRAKPLEVTEKADRRLSWCAAFVLWVLWMAGHEVRGNFWVLRRVQTLYETAIACKAVLLDGEAPQPGDLVLWIGAGAHDSAGPSGHVAMISEVGGALMRTIGGNEWLDAEKTKQGVNERWLKAGDTARIKSIVRPSRMLKAG